MNNRFPILQQPIRVIERTFTIINCLTLHDVANYQQDYHLHQNETEIKDENIDTINAEKHEEWPKKTSCNKEHISKCKTVEAKHSDKLNPKYNIFKRIRIK